MGSRPEHVRLLTPRRIAAPQDEMFILALGEWV
jgi:hypothetical protein